MLQQPVKKGNKIRELTFKCRVCEDSADVHLHFGARFICSSCKSFFRRWIRTARPIPTCKLLRDCKIDTLKRTECVSCRFKKCLDVGLKPSLVKTGKELELRKKTRKQKRPSEVKEENTSCIAVLPVASSSHQILPINDQSSLNPILESNTFSQQTKEDNPLSDTLSDINLSLEFNARQLEEFLTQPNLEELAMLNPSLNDQSLTLFDPSSSIPRHLETQQTIEEGLLIDFLVLQDNKLPIEFSKSHMDKMMHCIKTDQRYPNDVIWTNTIEHANKMIKFVTVTDQFNNLTFNDQFTLLPRVNKQMAFITYAFYATPMRITPIWETTSQMKTQQTEVTKATSMTLKQIMFPRGWYTSQDHQDQVNDLVQRMTHLSFDQTSFLLTYLMAFFQGQDSASISEAKKFFQKLLYSHLKSKMGKVFAAPMMERHVKAITDMENVPEVNFPDKIN